MNLELANILVSFYVPNAYLRIYTCRNQVSILNKLQGINDRWSVCKHFQYLCLIQTVKQEKSIWEWYYDSLLICKELDFKYCTLGHFQNYIDSGILSESMMKVLKIANVFTRNVKSEVSQKFAYTFTKNSSSKLGAEI